MKTLTMSEYKAYSLYRRDVEEKIAKEWGFSNFQFEVCKNYDGDPYLMLSDEVESKLLVQKAFGLEEADLEHWDDECREDYADSLVCKVTGVYAAYRILLVDGDRTLILLTRD